MKSVPVGSYHNLRTEEQMAASGYLRIAGVDEAGRGALAGPVVAAAVLVYPQAYHPLVTDSKQLTPGRREQLLEWIQANALAIGVGEVGADTIDRINILRATFSAMQQAVEQLEVTPDFLLVDGRDFPFSGRRGAALVRGDLLSFSIACASIVAKVTRDRLLRDYDQQWPEYGFAHHKGYGTARHLEALRQHGPLAVHRDTFLRNSRQSNSDTQPTFWEERDETPRI